MRERGAAILIVLWSLALVSGLAISVGGTAGLEAGIARNMILAAKARHAAEAGLHHAILLAMMPDRELLPETPLDVRLFETQLRLRVRDECGKVDLNTGTPELVRRVVASAVPQTRATRIADAILDWRDPDRIPRSSGAEDADYRESGVGHGARDGLLEAVEELHHVRGMTPDAFVRLQPLVTVDCLNAGIDPLQAPAGVLRAIAGPDHPAVEKLLRWRRTVARKADRNSPIGPFVGHALIEAAPGHAFEITATARLASGVTARRRAVVFLTGDAQRPVILRDIGPWAMAETYNNALVSPR